MRFILVFWNKVLNTVCCSKSCFSLFNILNILTGISCRSVTEAINQRTGSSGNRMWKVIFCTQSLLFKNMCVSVIVIMCFDCDTNLIEKTGAENDVKTPQAEKVLRLWDKTKTKVKIWRGNRGTRCIKRVKCRTEQIYSSIFMLQFMLFYKCLKCPLKTLQILKLQTDCTHTEQVRHYLNS